MAPSTRLPLTEAQTALWMAHCLDPASPALSTAEYIEIAAPVSTVLLSEAIGHVLNETECMRLVFGDDGGVAWQSIGTPEVADVPIMDLRQQPDRGDAVELALTWMRSELARPAQLDSTATPIAGCAANPVHGEALFVLPGGDVLWYQRAHHIAVDGYAVALIAQRVAAVYSALSRGEAVGMLPEGRLAQVLDADEQYRNSPQRAVDHQFWTGLLSDVEPAVSLSETTAGPSPVALRATGQLGAAELAGLQRAASEHGVSWPDVVFALHALYLHRMTAAACPVLGVPLMNRLGGPAVTTPAMVMNIAAVPVPVGDLDTIADVARRVARQRRTFSVHRDYRYEQLRRDLHRFGAGKRLFGPLVNILGFTPALSFAGSAARAHTLSTGPVEDLNVTVAVARSDSGAPVLTLAVDANPACYQQAEVDDHRDRLLALLGVAATMLTAAVRSVPILTAVERDTVLYRWNDTAHPLPETTLVQLLDEQARRTPDAPAVTLQGAALSYAELAAHSNAHARRLIERGAGPGTRVAIALPRSLELVVGLLAILKTGAAYLPVDPDYPPQRVELILGDATPICVLGPAEGQVNIDLAARPAPAASGPVTDADRLSPLTPDAAAYVIYTSGSTGTPKGVVISHRAIVNRLLWMQDEYSLDDTDRVLQKTPSGFDVSVWEFFWPLISGARLVLAVPGGHQDPAYLSQLIRAQAITTAHFVPSMLRLFLDEPTSADCATALRRVFCSGEALPADSARRFLLRFPDVELHNLYGPTEAAVDVTAWRCSGEDVEIPIGRPVWNTRLYILDRAQRPVPVGVTGELYLAGVQLAQGYLNRPELTNERFVPDPFATECLCPVEARMYRTGDLARWRPDGAVQYHGRIDDQVKLRGMRIELGEIEAALLREPGVAAAIVVLREDRPGDQRLVAYIVAEAVVSEAGQPLDVALLRAEVGRELPGYMVPSAVLVLLEIPLTVNGKLNRAALPAPPDADRSSEVADTPRVELLCRLFAESLGVPQLGVDDNFFDHGGHSLLAASLARQISTTLGLPVTVGAIFAAASPRALAASLGVGGDGGGTEPLLVLRQAEGVPLWCVHPAGGLGWCYTGLLPHLPGTTPVYAMQARSLSPGDTVPSGMEDLVKDYVEQMLAVQTEGPFQLLGWSVGGVIAHALAVELRARGHKVGLLALLDAYPADQWRDLDLPEESDALRALLHIGGIDPASVPTLARTEVITVLREAGSALSALDAKVLAAMVDVVVNNNRLMHTHHHAVLDTDVVFFTAAEPRSEDWLDRDGWRQYIDGELVNVDLPCTHPQMMSKEMLAVIGTEVSAWIC